MPAQTRLLEFLVSLLHGSLVCPILCVTRLMKLSVTWALPVLTAPSPCKAPHGAFPVFCTGAVQRGWSATKILIFAVPGYIFTSFPLTVQHLHGHCTLDMACSSLSARSFPVLALDWGLQLFHSIIPELEHLHRHCYLFFACTCLQTLQWQCLPQSIWLALYSGHFSMREDFLLPRTSFSFVHVFLLSSMHLFLHNTWFIFILLLLCLHSATSLSWSTAVISDRVISSLPSSPDQYYILSVLTAKV